MKRKTIRFHEETVESIEAEIDDGEYRDFTDAVRKALWEVFGAPSEESIQKTRGLSLDDLDREELHAEVESA